MDTGKVAAIVLGYKEPGWTAATVNSALACPEMSDTFSIYRENGIGGMASVFNAGMEIFTDYCTEHSIKWVWHLTNVKFPANMLGSLLEHADETTAAIHPRFNSDHPHMCESSQDGRQVPFVEWTAPLVSLRAWLDVGPLDSNMPYWGFDLDWSKRAIDKGYTLKVCCSCSLDHTYLRDKDAEEHRVTTERRHARKLFDRSTEDLLAAKWGEDWLAKLWPTHPYVAAGKKRIYAER